MKNLIILIICFNVILSAQGNIAQYAIWEPKEGQEQEFEAGYKKHLEWHKQNNDPWDWYGWYFISGPRTGQFIDATFDHTWSQFDSPVKPQEDRADNKINVYPYADLQTVFKVSKLDDLSTSGNDGLKSKFIRFLTLSVNNVSDAKQVISKLKSNYISSSPVNGFYVYSVVDGGEINQIIIMMGFRDYYDFGKTENIFEELAAIEESLSTLVIDSISSETMVYRDDMSLF